VVWGTCGDDGDNVVWGTSGKVDVRAWNDGDDNVVWGTSGSDGDAAIFDDPLAPPLSFDEFVFESLLGADGSDPVEEPVLGSGGIL
jgi:hypothetical protein